MQIEPLEVLRAYPDSDIRQRIRALARDRAHALNEGADPRRYQDEIEKLQAVCPHPLAAEQMTQTAVPQHSLVAGDRFLTCWDCRKFLGKS